MHLERLFPAFLVFCVSASAVVHERRIPHSSLTLSRRLEADVTIPLRIGLKQQNMNLLSDHLLAVSDPQSRQFGQHWTPEHVAEVFAPANESRDAVNAWLVESGFHPHRLGSSHNKAWIYVKDATVAEVEGLLDTEYHVYTHESGEEHAACDSYSLPAHIVQHIDFITPTVQPNIKIDPRPFHTSPRASFERAAITQMNKPRPSAPALPAGCDQRFTPECARSLYNITYVPQATDRNSFGMLSHAPSTFLQQDLNTFFANFSPNLVGKEPIVASINGGSTDFVNGTTGVGEVDWILQYMMTLTQPQPVTVLQVGNLISGNSISFNEWLDAVDGSYCTSDGGDDLAFDPQYPNLPIGDFQEHSCGTAKPPLVISVSRGDYEFRLPPFYTQRQCNEFAKLGLMGVTVLFSAGNVGAAGTTLGYCRDDNGSVNLNATHFNPGWPAACPWITAVGGTQVKANASDSAGGVKEEVWNQDQTHGFFLSGGGGFSNRFPMPRYQKAAVTPFLNRLKKTNPAQLKHFNPSGRAYPDISANANNFVSVEEGEFVLSSGTSGATPTVASIIALINDARLSAGKTPVGFINPTIYSPQFAGAFNDIVSGTSQGCKGWQGDRAGGFKAGPGWDAASGVGTPNAGLLIEKWLSLP
ncbi:Tripeptidyl-peptidase sed1 [Favolaschia claudopus]|uniref:tripeptidyl-peptidase II n=1 Tax=Favolaschia claudopus TaxID=2862362 RepID=A0AAW0BFN7_9AGAR